MSHDNRRRGANQPRIRKAASRCPRVDDDASLVRGINVKNGARSCLTHSTLALRLVSVPIRKGPYGPINRRVFLVPM